MTTPEPSPVSAPVPFGHWHRPFVVARNHFKGKSLSCWSANPYVGCLHGCTFCYVPEVSTRRMGPALKPLGVNDPDAEWGKYAFLRHWDRHEWRKSIAAAERAPLAELNADGNRAVMYSTTTDAFQMPHHPDAAIGRQLRQQAEQMITESLTDLLELTTLNVRILTRSPWAKQFFPLMKRFGNRLLFGMSLPTLSHRLSNIYEPHAPAPLQRLKTLEQAAAYGIPAYVAMAPVYPDCEQNDMFHTLTAIARLKPVTVFMEPLNIRAENVARIRAQAGQTGEFPRLEVFDSTDAWLRYAWNSILLAKNLGEWMKLPMHLWPDASMGTKANVARLAELLVIMSQAEIRQQLESCWNRISEWPGKPA